MKTQPTCKLYLSAVCITADIPGILLGRQRSDVDLSGLFFVGLVHKFSSCRAVSQREGEIKYG